MAGTISSLATPAALSASRLALDPLVLPSKPSHFDVFTFYDARFAEAHSLAQQLDEQPLATDGDVTAIWQNWLSASNHPQNALYLQGVTTESFYFCLRVLLESDHQRVEPTLTRLNRDLHVWTIETLPVNS